MPLPAAYSPLHMPSRETEAFFGRRARAAYLGRLVGAGLPARRGDGAPWRH